MSSSEEEMEQWGYVIFRTVYTPESSSVWESVKAKLTAYISNSPPYEDDGHGPYGPPVLQFMDDATRYDGMSIHQTRAKFLKQVAFAFFDGENGEENDELLQQKRAEYLQSVFGSCDGATGGLNAKSNVHESIFLVVDEDALHSILAAPDDPEKFKHDRKQKWAQGPLKPTAYVKAVDTRHEPQVDGRWERRPGWMKASLISLGWLFTFEEMDHVCPDWFPGLGVEWYPIWEGKTLRG